MRFKLEGRTYNVATVDRLSLRDLLMLEKETAELGQPMKWSDLKRIVNDTVAAIGAKDEGFEDRDDFPWFLGIIIWAARRDAGEELTFSEAVDFPLADFEFLPEPEDHKVATHPQQARPVGPSGRARAAAGSKPKGKKKTSATP